MKSQHIEHASIETVGVYNPDAGEYVTICMPESHSPKNNVLRSADRYSSRSTGGR